MTRAQAIKQHLWIYLLGGLLTSGLGMLLTLPIGDGLARLSYDVPFLFQSGGDSNVVMIFVNPSVKANLHQSTDLPLDRSLYIQLVERLHRDGARLILFDLLSFDTPHANPEVDKRFATVAREHGRVVLVSASLAQDQLGAALQVITPIVPAIQSAVAGYGLCNVDVDSDPDRVIRHIFMGTESDPSVAWVALSLLDASVARNDANRLRSRWLNYYGPPGKFRGVNLDQVLAADGVHEGFFRNKIVVVGAGSDVALAGAAQDEYSSPYSRFGERPFFGAEIQALTLLNLVHRDYLERLNPRPELFLIVVWGFFCAFGLSGRRPWNAALIALGGVILVFGAALFLQLKQHLWCDWLIPVVQLPVALVWSVGYQYLTETRRRRQLRRAFSAYLSPYMADQIANSEFDLSLGGKEVEATVMFTDLEGFTKMSESLAPAEVSKILTSYFNQTTRVILEQNGTIIKYIGDAVMAVWGAPLRDERHAERAVLAAWGMSEAGKQEIEGRRLRTRIGVNTGLVLAGNLGSDFRFDYTLIGDTTNFASRLEGLNKYLRTDILVSETTRQQLSDKIKLRFLGRFIVSGKKSSVGIYEVLGPAAAFTQNPAWLSAFEQGVDSFVKGDLDQAERLMRQVHELRAGKDGPAEFYLKEISNARLSPNPIESWDGSIVLDSK